MTIFNALTLVGGLCLFLFGMNVMGQALERRAGGKLRTLLDKMTSRVFVGFLTGLGITAIIQSSSATTVMVVGFVNSGLMTLRQAINVIMGANVGTTVTAWLLSLAGIDSGSAWVQLLKPSSFTPVLALIGIIFYMFCKSDKKKDTGTILLGFATLMFGMETMSGAVSGLKDVPEFTQLFLMFRNPILGVLVGAVLTGIIQSSSASVGILQALSVTGGVSYAAAIPIIMGQNIGTCVTAMLSSVGTNKNAHRAAVVHLMFNVIGVVVLLTLFCIVKAIFAPAILDRPATMYGIAIAHSVFNILCTAMLLPAGNLLEKLAIRLVPDAQRREETSELDARLLATPALALGQARNVAGEMAACAVRALENALTSLTGYTPELARSIREDEERCDHYEDIIGTYLVQLSSRSLSDSESQESTELLKTIGDFERISDHAVNVLESAEELQSKGLSFSPAAMAEYETLARAIRERYDQYDGFVISHGTDTMAYTAAALSYLIQDCPKPIVLTGAQKPIWYDGTDSKRNLTDAFLYACRGCGGVQIVFNGKVILGTRARKTFSKSFQAFSSVNYPELALIQDERLLQYITTGSRPAPRFYDALSGTVKVDGRDVREYTLENLRSGVSMVLQNGSLFSGTIADNLRWADPNATLAQMQAACAIARADEYIDRFPDGYDTVLEQNAANLSGGQRQRLLIARAILKKPRILILDDSTSAVDMATDEHIRRCLRTALPGATKVIIAQRINSIMSCDRIVVLDQGRLADMGTHQELLSRSHIYRDVYESQMREGAVDHAAS